MPVHAPVHHLPKVFTPSQQTAILTAAKTAKASSAHKRKAMVEAHFTSQADMDSFTTAVKALGYAKATSKGHLAAQFCCVIVPA